MSSLNEEEFMPEPELGEPNVDLPDNVTAHRMSKENTCTERSDSGFSDCSNSSNGHAALNGNTLVAHPLFDKANSISEEKEKSTSDSNQLPATNGNNVVKEVCGKVSVNMLKLKLEKIAEAQADTPTKPPITTRTAKTTNGSVEEPKSIPVFKCSASAVFEPASMPSPEQSEGPLRTTLARSTSLQLKKPVDKEPIMKSDFTNTVKMRKKSLESNALRDKQPVHSSPRVLLEKSGKVSKLLQRFSNEPSPTPEREFVEKTPQENALIECTSTPLTAIAVAQQQVVTKVVMAKATTASKSSTVSTQSVKRSPLQERKARTTAPVVANRSMGRKSVFERLSPTRHSTSLTNTRHNASASHSVTPSSSTNKRFVKLNSVESSGTAIGSSVVTTTNTKSAVVTATAQKSTAYASFNRTSPVRLSGRVKEVTDRLSTPKTPLKKPIAIRPTSHSSAAVAKSNGKVTSMVDESRETTAIVTSTAITSTTQRRQITNSSMSIENYQKFVSNKDEGDFAAQSQKMNENFKKASAFWKTT